MQPAAKRKNLHRTIRYPALIESDAGGEPISCTLCDASQEGAHLQINDPAAVPEEFTLVLGYDGTARRRCKVISRTNVQVGVEFKKMPRILLNTKAAVREAEVDNSFDIDSLSSR